MTFRERIERLALTYRRQATKLRHSKGRGPDAGMDEYIWKRDAMIYDRMADDLEELLANY